MGGALGTNIPRSMSGPEPGQQNEMDLDVGEEAPESFEHEGSPLVPDDDEEGDGEDVDGGEEENEDEGADVEPGQDSEDDDQEPRYRSFTKSVFHHPQTDQDTVNSTRSLYDSDVVYIKQFGRIYIGDYYMPIDEEELDRLRIIHQIYLQVFNNELTTIPLDTPTRILDIGTGSGEWACGMGDLWPEAEIIGTDIAKVQPTAVPLNVFFEIDDAEEEGGWTWPADEFDLVHLRSMAGAFSNWDHIYREAFMHLKPGGWIEVMDFDDHRAFFSFFDVNSNVPKLLGELDVASRKSGRPRGVEHLDIEKLRKIGFVEVGVRDFTIPMGTWPEERAQKTIGKLFLVAMLNSLEGYLLRLLTREMGWEEEDVRKACREFEDEMKVIATDPERARGMHIVMRVLVGRKPFPGEVEGEGKQNEAGDEEEDGESIMTETPTINGSTRQQNDEGE